MVTSWETITNPNGQQMRRRKGADYDEKRVQRVAKGSGRKETEVKELLNKFAMMRQMMTQMGAQSGLLGQDSRVQADRADEARWRASTCRSS